MLSLCISAASAQSPERRFRIDSENLAEGSVMISLSIGVYAIFNAQSKIPSTLTPPSPRRNAADNSICQQHNFARQRYRNLQRHTSECHHLRLPCLEEYLPQPARRGVVAGETVLMCFCFSKNKSSNITT